MYTLPGELSFAEIAGESTLLVWNQDVSDISIDGT
jgi:hypothetical protein